MEHRRRNTALVLIAAGAYLLLGKFVGYYTVSSLLILTLGVYGLKYGRRGGLILLIGALMLLGSHFSAIAPVFLIIGGIYLLKRSRDLRRSDAWQRRSVLESIRYVHSPWELKNKNIWSVIGEIRMDFSLAILEEGETTLVLQGIIGDIDLLIPEDLDVRLQGSVMLGQLRVGGEKEAGVLNHLDWQTPGYGSGRHQVKLVVSYIVGDIDITLI